MKHFISYLLTMSLVVSGILYPKKSHAVIGVTSPAGVGALVVGLWIGGGISLTGVAIYLSSKIEDKIKCDTEERGFSLCRTKRALLKTLIFLAGAAGVMALDSEQNPNLQEIDEDRRDYFGLSVDELTAYNEDVPKINGINQSAINLLKDKEELSKEEQITIVENYIIEQRKTLNPLTLIALEKIGTAIARMAKADIGATAIGNND